MLISVMIVLASIMGFIALLAVGALLEKPIEVSPTAPDTPAA